MGTKKATAPAAKAPAPVDKHANHVTIDQVSWSEAKGQHSAYRLCSCGAKRALEG